MPENRKHAPWQPSWMALDKQHIWHPYSAIGSDLPIYPVASAEGVRLTLTDGRKLIDGMSSWWSAIHGYNVSALNHAVTEQATTLAHVMFGGLTHQPAAQLAKTLVDLTPTGLDTVFFADSGSVAVEVAMKMAIQYWHSKGQPNKQRFISLRNGYHGDTLGAMSVCDPVTGMHALFSDSLQQQFFVPPPQAPFGNPCEDKEFDKLIAILEANHAHIAAFILEPIVQGAGGMRFYSADYLRRARELCDEYDILLIADEIATGFGRSGTLFACEHAAISPDILCLGKALTGGYMSLAATLASQEIAETISQSEPGVFMHGPTFMANPLACAVANASITLLLNSPWQTRVQHIEQQLKTGLAACQALPQVAHVRCVGAIGVVELKQPVDMQTITKAFVEQGVWVRPFGKLVYLMPPYVITDLELETLTSAVHQVVSAIEIM